MHQGLKRVSTLEFIPAGPVQRWPNKSVKPFRKLTFTPDGKFGTFLSTVNLVNVFELMQVDGQYYQRDVHELKSDVPITAVCFVPNRGEPRSGFKIVYDINELVDRNGKKREPRLYGYFIITGLITGDILIWSGFTGNTLSKLLDHKCQVTDFAVTPRLTGYVQVLSVSVDSTLKIWDFEGVYEHNMGHSLRHEDHMLSVDWAPNGQLICAGGNPRTVFVYRIERKVVETLHRLQGHTSPVIRIQFSEDSTTIVTASHDTRVNIWDVLTGNLRQTLCHTYPVPDFNFNKPGVLNAEITKFGHEVFSISQDKRLRIWNLSDMYRDTYYETEVRTNLVNPVLPLMHRPDADIVLSDFDSTPNLTIVNGAELVMISGKRDHRVIVYKRQVKFPTLVELCRIKVRDLITDQRTGVDGLEIPKMLIEYLKHFVR